MHLCREQRPPGSCCEQAGVGSSSKWDRLCFLGDIAARPSYNDVLPQADICSPSLVDLWVTGKRLT